MATLQVMEMQGGEALLLNMAQDHQEIKKKECLKQGSKVTVECLSSVAGRSDSTRKLAQDKRQI